jgi:phosphoribosylformylglycinamidine synthase
MDSIAGISNSYGNVFGLMPHPERFVFPSQYPASQNLVDKTPWGRIIFQNAVDYIG